MSDDFPFDRDHVLVSFNFPTSEIARKREIFKKVINLASHRGGTDAGTSQPDSNHIGKPGYQTFGIQVAFEAHDINIQGFISQARSLFAGSKVQVSYDPHDIIIKDFEDATLSQETSIPGF